LAKQESYTSNVTQSARQSQPESTMYLASRELLDKTKDVRVNYTKKKRGSRVTSLDLRLVM